MIVVRDTTGIQINQQQMSTFAITEDACLACPGCFESASSAPNLLECGHFFCESCVRIWMSKHNTESVVVCPYRCVSSTTRNPFFVEPSNPRAVLEPENRRRPHTPHHVRILLACCCILCSVCFFIALQSAYVHNEHDHSPSSDDGGIGVM